MIIAARNHTRTSVYFIDDTERRARVVQRGARLAFSATSSANSPNSTSHD